MVSEKPWSDYKESDYTAEQWHRACLIHQHSGAPTSKAQCKLPVRTPNGAINRNGVYAAAAALGGARGGINASSDEIGKAKASLRRLYSELEADPPASLSHSKEGGTMSDALTLDEELIIDRNPLFEGEEFFEEHIEHYGIKGMKWGRRKVEREGPSQEAIQVGGINARVSTQKSTAMLSNKELRDAIERMRLEQQYSQMSGGLDKTRRQKAKQFVEDLIYDTAIGTTKQQTAQLANGQVKDIIDQKLKQGSHDPIAKAERAQKSARLEKAGFL